MRALSRTGRRRLAVVVGLLGVLFASLADAQQDERPSNQRPEVPPFEVEDAPTLPVDPLVRPESGPAVARVVVRRFVFEGNTAFSDEALAAVLADRIGRALATEDLIAARDAITRHYVGAGYETSGALLPDQDVSDGVVRFRVIEGELVDVEIIGTDRFSPRYFEARLLEAGKAPLDVAALETALQVFQQDPLIERVSARIEPTARLGRSRMTLEVEEARPDDVRLLAENDRSPTVGAETGAFRIESNNWIGHRDRVALAGWFTEGLRDVQARWAMPLDRFDTRLETRFRFSESELVEAPFSELDIESESFLVSIGVARPVHRTRSHVVELGLTADWRRGQSTLDGSLFCFQPDVVDCSPTIAALRSQASWLWRGRDHALALRTGLSWGIGILGATTRAGNVPDGRFLSWLSQGQLALRTDRGALLVTRFDLQLTGDRLLAFERIAVGGARTVRGYRPNQLVRDNGFDASIEWREPILRGPDGVASLELVPFIDVGRAWDEETDDRDATIASLGLGLVARPHERIEASLFWGGRLLGVDRVGTGPIGEGIHFKVLVDVW